MKNTSGTITRYLTDDNSLTGYSQVLEELNGGYGVQKRYVYGLNLISQTDTMGTAGTQYYGYDGIGSVRLLTDSFGNLTDTYDYDAFGTLIYHNGTTTNVYLFQGQQYDSDLGQYYLRARYMNTDIGRFWTMDSYEGNSENPSSLHKYNFVNNDSINNFDPSGSQIDDITSLITISVLAILSTPVTVLYPKPADGEIILGVDSVPTLKKYNQKHTFLVFKNRYGITEKIYEAVSEYVLYRNWGYEFQYSVQQEDYYKQNTNQKTYYNMPFNLGKLIKLQEIERDCTPDVYYLGIDDIKNKSEAEIMQIKNKMQALFVSYHNDIDYWPIPIQGLGGNSNSFTSTILNDSGFNEPEPNGATGWGINIF